MQCNAGDVYFVETLLAKMDNKCRRNFLTKRSKQQPMTASAEQEFNPLEEEEVEEAAARAGHTCLYVGSAEVGSRGDFDRIEVGIRRVLGCLPAAAGTIAVIQLSDIELRVFEQITDELILRYFRCVHQDTY